MDDQEFQRRYDRLQRALPGTFGRVLGWVRRPASRWVRIPLGILLLVGGLLSFLPVLGAWMVPVGVRMLAQVLPVQRRALWGARVAVVAGWFRRQARRRPPDSR